jgi:hypothetical protein
MDDLPPDAAALLRAARRAHEPSAADSERVHAALKATLASSAASTPPGPDVGAGSAASSVLTPTLGKLALLVGLLGGGLLWSYGGARNGTPASSRGDAVGRSAQAAQPLSEATSVRANSGAALAKPAAVSAGLEGGASTRASEPNVSALPEWRAPAAATRDLAPLPPAKHASRRKERALPPAAHARRVTGDGPARAPAGDSAAPVAPQPVPSSAPRTDAERADDTPGASPAPAVAPRQSSAAGELALIRAALTRLNAGDAPGALALLEAHAAGFPEGVMRDERVGLRAIALCTAGESEAGRAQQQLFLQRAPSSTLAARVRRACAEKVP